MEVRLETLMMQRGPLAAAAAVLVVLGSLAAAAVAAGAPAPKGPRPVALIHARVETVAAGVIEDATVVLRDGKIAEVEKGLAAPAGARVIDLKGGTVMPGIVSPVSRLGLGPSGGGGGGEPGGGRFGGRGGGGPRGGGGGGAADLRAIDEVDPFDEAYRRVLGRAGVTSIGLAPFGDGVAGQGSVIRPTGEKRDAMAVAESAFLWVTVETETQALETLEKAFADAKKEIEARKKAEEERKKKEEEEKKKKDAEAAEKKKEEEKPAPAPKPEEKKDEPAPSPKPEEKKTEGEGEKPAAPKPPEKPRTDPRKEPLIAVVEGRLPLFLSCGGAADLLHFLAVLERAGVADAVKPVVVASGDVYRAADELKKRDLPVLVAPDVTNEPFTRNRMLVARMLHEQGVRVAFYAGGDGPSDHETLLARAAEAVRFGLPRDAVLRALTLAPAERLGIDSRVGSVTKGKDANLIVCDGDPLDARTRVLSVWLEGVPYDPDFGNELTD